MPNQDYQRHTFLGGEVSPSLYERADMDKFSKWFSKAENVRFFETGGFRNRPGFVKVADTKNNKYGEVIKLLSFSFNDEESFLVEFGPGYARFYKHGQPILSEGVVYEIQTPFLSFSEEDIKYAQAGDIIFIVHPSYGIYELSRLKADGTEWSIKKFASSSLPSGDENEDEDVVLSLSNTTTYPYIRRFTVTETGSEDGKFSYAALYLDNELIWSNDVLADYSQYAAGFTTALSSSGISCAYANQTFTFYSTQNLTNAIKVVARKHNVGKYSYFKSAADYGYTDGFDNTHTGSVQSGWFYGTDTFYIKSLAVSARVSLDQGATYEWKTLTFEASDLNSVNNSAASIASQSPAISYAGSSDGVIMTCGTNVFNGGYSGVPLKYGCAGIQMEIVTDESVEITYNAENVSNDGYNTYTLSADNTNHFFSVNGISVGDQITITRQVPAHHINAAATGSSYVSPEVFSDGSWRLLCTGVWTGSFTLQYSIDNKATWRELYSWSSQNQDYPNNPNTSGVVESPDKTVWFRIVGSPTIGEGTCNINFSTSNYETNSVYEVMAVLADNLAIVKAVKNDVGTFSSEYRWRPPAFSNALGWPQTIGFYQNRLFLGKDYLLYGSRTNDFWDFYTPVTVKDSDPIILSLLSTKVNGIKNIVTQRSFFTFTAGGEFGIGSEGALSQSDRYLKPFSSNGSAQCSPVLISDVVLFVDKSCNSVRALKYALESDGYEAPDITLTLRYLLRNEKIISTDHIFEEKEALFLSDTGIVWVLKYITDQNILSWSHWKHAWAKITNICVVPNGAKNDLYIACEDEHNGKWIEMMSEDTFMDTAQSFSATDNDVTVTGEIGSEKLIYQNGSFTKATVSIFNTVKAPSADYPFVVGTGYETVGTLLSPTLQISDYAHTNYHKKAPFKVWFYYTESYGFKVGIDKGEKMEIQWQEPNSDVDGETDLTSGKKSVLIPSRFDGSARVSFVQSRPYPMEIQDVLIETDFGGK